MRIGIVVTTSPGNGGTYYYSIGLLNALRNYGQHHEYVLFYDWSDFPTHKYPPTNWIRHHYTSSDKGRWDVKIARLLSTLGLTSFRWRATGRHKAICHYSLDLVICPSTTLAAWWCNVPFIVAIHDIWHRRKLLGTTIFSEPFRDIIWRRAAKAAKLIIVESELGKKELIKFYEIPESQIRILPTGPAPFIWDYDSRREVEVRAKFNLPSSYVFYPGGFAPAKNQQCVIKAVALLNKKYNLDIHAVFTGPLGQYGKLMQKLAIDEGIESLVHFLGLVPDQDMALLYKAALCLVMASYIGPTNMPIWEAFATGCPVISSNAGEMAKQVSNAGLLFDPSNTNQLAECILKIYFSRKLCMKLIDRGFQRIQPLQPENWAHSLLDAIESVVM